LIGGILCFLIGLTPSIGFVYSVIISVSIYFGIKVFVGRRQKMIERDVGEGFCAECGSKIVNKKCPICDRKKSKNE